MDRRVTEVRVAEGVRRFRVVVTDDDSEPGSQRAHARQLAFLAELLHQPVLLASSPGPHRSSGPCA